ncbi:MAG TPA: PIN domain-containing protein [Thermoanaerobaculia bacterium]|nr:PIN domain-containing protein [Thermoanaerobaculia bacterium]
MVLVDTSVWVDVFRDTTLARRRLLERATEADDIFLTRFHQIEILQGARDQKEWDLLDDYLADQDYLETSTSTWAAAARIYFDLRRRGRTVRSTIDCCIAQIALDHEVLLLHRDRDFETIATVRPLRERRMAWS